MACDRVRGVWRLARSCAFRPDGGITVYYPEDDEHEEISLPEPTIVFSTQPDGYVTVTRDMLPSV